jgi:hypothetical protein
MELIDLGVGSDEDAATLGGVTALGLGAAGLDVVLLLFSWGLADADGVAGGFSPCAMGVVIAAAGEGGLAFFIGPVEIAFCDAGSAGVAVFLGAPCSFFLKILNIPIFLL